MTMPVSIRDLTLPEALMAFLHAPNGRPYETVKPPALTAAAEVAELVTAGHARLDGDRSELLVVDAPAASGPGTDRAWVPEVTARLAGRPVEVAAWVRGRRDALPTQQAEAAARGVLVQGRARLMGLVPYDTNTVDPAVRQQLLELLTAPDAEADPRAAVLARLLVRSRLHLRGEVDRAQRARLEEVAERAPSTTPAPAALDALDLAMVTIVYTTVIGE